MDNNKFIFDYDNNIDNNKDNKEIKNKDKELNKGQLDYIFNNNIKNNMEYTDIRFGQSSRSSNQDFKRNREALLINRFDYLDSQPNKVLPYNMITEGTREKKILPTTLNTRKTFNK